MAYSSSQKMSKKEMKRKGITKQDLQTEPDPPKTPASKKPIKKREGKPMTTEQKADLAKHMAEHKEVKDLSTSEKRSHRMKMMVRMRKGMTLSEAHKDIS